MPAKPLSAEQLDEAAKLKHRFEVWQGLQRAERLPASQVYAAERLGIRQSAFSQYLGGKLPLNPPIVRKFAELLGVKAGEISRLVTVAERERRRADLSGESVLKATPVPGPAIQLAALLQDLSGLNRALVCASVDYLVTHQNEPGIALRVQKFIDQISRGVPDEQ